MNKIARVLCPECGKRYLTRGFELCGLCEWRKERDAWTCNTPPCRQMYITKETGAEHYARIKHDFPKYTDEELEAERAHFTENQYRDRAVFDPLEQISPRRRG